MNKNQLFWASRRGMLELDLILLPFVEKAYPQLSDNDKRSFESLLECEDQDLLAWLLRGEHPSDEAIQKIVQLVRSRCDPNDRI